MGQFTLCRPPPAWRRFTHPISPEQRALAIAVDHARNRGVAVGEAPTVALAGYDQWTVPNGFDLHRPMFSIEINDSRGTKLYVSSTTGEVVLDTTRRERWWNYAGSVLHWIYPTVLRSNWAAWDKTVWSLSLVAVIAAISGAVLGLLRISRKHHRLTSPYRGWHAWHHLLRLISLTFVLTWIVSGWLSMDHGRLFSTGRVSDAEAAAIIGAPSWGAVPLLGVDDVPEQTIEIE